MPHTCHMPKCSMCIKGKGIPVYVSPMNSPVTTVWPRLLYTDDKDTCTQYTMIQVLTPTSIVTMQLNYIN